MKFFLPEVKLEGSKYLYFCKDRPRYATATDIFCLDDERIIIASMYESKLYLSRVEEGQLNIIQELKTKKPIDLFDFKDNLIVSANAFLDGISTFELENNEIKLIKNIRTPKNIRVHGVHIIDSDRIIFASNNHLVNSISKREVYNCVKLPCKAKDILIHNNKLIAIVSETYPDKKPVNNSKTYLQIYNLETLELLNQVSFEGQADAMSIYKENIFVTIQDLDAVFIFKLKDNEITFTKSIDGFNFPHGIHINLGKMFVTNYGDNSIQILDVEKIIES
jgi:hypothetical protein